jgi:hypothetical protein
MLQPMQAPVRSLRCSWPLRARSTIRAVAWRAKWLIHDFRSCKADFEGLSTVFPRSVRIAGRGHRLVVAVVGARRADPGGAGPCGRCTRVAARTRPTHPSSASQPGRGPWPRSYPPGWYLAAESTTSSSAVVVGHGLRARMALNTPPAGAHRVKAAGAARLSSIYAPGGYVVTGSSACPRRVPGVRDEVRTRGLPGTQKRPKEPPSP